MTIGNILIELYERLIDMKIGLDLIYERIQNKFRIVKKKLKGPVLECRFPELYFGKMPEVETVCVVNAESMSKDLLERQDILIICAGIKEQMDKGKCQYIMTDGEKDAKEIYAEIADLFCRISEWKEHLYDISMMNGSLQEIIDASSSMFSREILYLNGRFEVLAYSVPGGKLKDSEAEYQEWLERENRGNVKSLSLSIKDMEISLRKKVPYVYHYTQNKEDLYYLSTNVKELNRGIGHIAVNIGTETATNTQIWLLEFLRKVLERYFRNYLLIEQKHQRNIQGVFYSILDGIQFDRQMIEKQLQKLGISFDDRFICIKVTLANANMLGVPAIYFCTQIEQILGRAYSVQYDSQIVVLVNLTTNEINFEEAMKELTELLIRNNLKAGISNEFNDIFKSKNYYLQAKKAYEIGSVFHPELSTYHFIDYAVNYILMHSADELPVEMVCAKGLIRLLEYEKESSVEYCKTLSTYIRNNMNAVLTAKMLYIHRSTMLFRLNHITEILQMDLKDPDDRLYLEISLKLLGKYE